MEARYRRDGADPLRVVRQVKAGLSWERDANVRDVLGRKDLAFNGEATAEVLNRRRREDRGPEPALSLAYPKDDGGFRQTCVLDPFDDIRYSLVASTAAPYVNNALPDSATVLSSRFVESGLSVYRAEGWREAKKRRGLRVDRSGSLCVGGFDVKNQFDTTPPALIGTLLNSSLAPSWLVDECVGLLHSFGAWPGATSGLPTGPMASALFGTFALLPVDRLLQRLGVPYERWVDDFVTQPQDERHFEFVRDAVDEMLRPHQGLNPNKHWFSPEAEPQASSSDLDLSCDEQHRSPSLEALRHAVSERDSKRCRFLLGSLRWRENAAAVPYVVCTPEVWRLAPKHSGDYLSALRSAVTEEQLQILTDFCSAPLERESAAGIAHAAGFLGKRRVSGPCGLRLFDAGERSATGQHRAVAPALYYASSVSREKPRHRQQRCIEAAVTLRDLNSQRALLAGLRHDTRSKVVDAGLGALGRAVGDLRPTVEWIIAGAPG